MQSTFHSRHFVFGTAEFVKAWTRRAPRISSKRCSWVQILACLNLHYSSLRGTNSYWFIALTLSASENCGQQSPHKATYSRPEVDLCDAKTVQLELKTLGCTSILYTESACELRFGHQIVKGNTLPQLRIEVLCSPPKRCECLRRSRRRDV